jgi:L-amino acid N-acyltransferase YncA
MPFEAIRLATEADLEAIRDIHNNPSLKLHSKLGFREVGVFPEIGFRSGQRWSLCWLIRPAHNKE